MRACVRSCVRACVRVRVCVLERTEFYVITTSIYMMFQVPGKSVQCVPTLYCRDN